MLKTDFPNDEQMKVTELQGDFMRDNEEEIKLI